MLTLSRGATLVALLLIAAVPAHAFDGKLNGVVIGAGAGGGFFTFTQTLDMEKSDRLNEGTFVTDFRFGGGLNEEFALYYHMRTSWFGLENLLGDEVTIASGVGGLGLLIHPDPETNRWYFTGTIGLASWGAPFEAGVDTWWGFGAELAVGFEFIPHWGAEISIGFGTPDETEGQARAATDFYTAQLTIIGLAY